jgi:hypothetical protein
VIAFRDHELELFGSSLLIGIALRGVLLLKRAAYHSPNPLTRFRGLSPLQRNRGVLAEVTRSRPLALASETLLHSDGASLH